ncbi:carbohydrate ABC transporter permease [Brachybacterium sacelli]|uniref:Multiple sugar transport system permease protein n=1 Tax=Brachybacterium sacelli TaxID=173364 RepID=A0ABS4WZX2_9MICO|nr:carbohydrate ABC transporter permease [Brachybacterium sacelli]MBP2381641.1 multiple sugar transport system permease protein [Brachybacterium sacelli]
MAVLTETAAPTTAPADRRTARRRRMLQPRWMLIVALKALVSLAIVALALFPLAWMIISGFKIRTEVVSTPFQFFPEVWRWQNYTAILSDTAFLRTLAITGFGAVIFTAGSIAVNSMAAYAFARLEFAGKRYVWPLVLMTMFIPGMTILLTSFIVVTDLHMLDTLAVLIIPGMATAAHIFFVRQFYLNIPSSLEEAAVMDGCGRWGVYLRIFLPLSKAPFVVVGITSFMAYWNNFVWPVMTITSPELFQVQQYLAAFRGERASELGLLMAGSACAALPIIVLFLVFQRQIIANIKMAGLK